MIRKGFTLIELLVVITVGIIIFGVGIAGYREFSRRQALTGIVKQVKADLRLAQQLAMTGQKPDSGTCAKLRAYTFLGTSTGYTITANCLNPAVANYLVKTVSLPADTAISPVSVSFKVVGQGTDLSGPYTFTLSNSVSGTSADVVISMGGAVK